MFASCENGDLARFEDCCDPHRKRLARDIRLAKEVCGCVASRDGIEVHEARAAFGAGAWLIEANVSSLSDAEQLKVNPAGVPDCLFESFRFAVHLAFRNGAIQELNVVGRDVDVGEEVFLHVASERVDAVGRHRPILVEIEGHNAGEAQSFTAVHANEFAVDANRCRAGGQAKHRSGALRAPQANQFGNALGNDRGECLVVAEYCEVDPLVGRHVGLGY